MRFIITNENGELTTPLARTDVMLTPFCLKDDFNGAQPGEGVKLS